MRRGAVGGSGRHEMEEAEHANAGNFSSDVLARLEQDLRATSFRERERLVAALEANLPAGQSFLFPVRASRPSSSRMMLPPEFDLSLNGLNRASHSARFSRVPVEPSPGSFRASAAWTYDHLPPHAQPFFLPPDPHSLSSRTMLPPEFDMSSVHRTSQSARLSDPYRASQSAQMSDLNRASRSFRMPLAAAQSTASTSAAGGAAGGSGSGGSYRPWATSPSISVNPLINTQRNSSI